MPLVPSNALMEHKKKVANECKRVDDWMAHLNVICEYYHVDDDTNDNVALRIKLVHHRMLGSLHNIKHVADKHICMPLNSHGIWNIVIFYSSNAAPKTTVLTISMHKEI